MTVMTAAQAGSQNRISFMDMLAYSEGTSSSPTTMDDGYDVIVEWIDGHPEIFTDFSTHPFFHGRPSKVINSKGLISSASGRYQFMLKDWVHYRDLLVLPDFGPMSQDRWCLQLLRERKALPLIDAGNLQSAISACANIWASLSGAGYGQHENSYDTLKAAFILNGGNVS